MVNERAFAGMMKKRLAENDADRFGPGSLRKPWDTDCRSEPAREKPEVAAGIQDTRAIVHGHRCGATIRQAGSHRVSDTSRTL